WDVVFVALVVERDDLFFEGAIERFAVAPVLLLGRNVDRPIADGEAVETVISLRPPAVEDRQIQPAVEKHFLSAGAARFLRPARIVQPYVDTLDEVAPHVDV